ncbi:MAG TPA: patatin-like phospholipase family protein [Ferruginibacter sp.]|nr:patatin-like phospholipase family protein [Ferruginibacter sp.]
MKTKTFHLGLCMAGSITAGAYTAGVIDYLIEALEEWENAKEKDSNVPDHQVVIDLFCGSSGGGMTGAMSLFALMDKMDHAKLNADGITYEAPKNNILWKSWVDLTDGDVFNELLSNDDITGFDIRSALNSAFIDKVASKLELYITELSKKKTDRPPFAGISPEMFMTLFNVTGINYELHTKSASGANSGNQYVSDHRDIAHFRWSDTSYPEKNMSNNDPANLQTNMADGRIPISFTNLKYLPVVIDAAKATGAFPIGLKARIVKREAKFIWDNPFFNRGTFDWKTIFLGKDLVNKRDGIYTSLNADGGTANNEPVELAQNILLNMRDKIYKDVDLGTKEVSGMNDTEKAVAVKTNLFNTSIILIDPFPSLSNEIIVPDITSSILPKYGLTLINAMNSQLIFDAKDALEAYKKANYGLHIISPAKKEMTASTAIACGSLGGFGGFLDREFRVHDFFLGRRNCQSFLRKYFVAKLNENNPGSRECIQAVLDGYNTASSERFAFEDENGELFVPIIPDVSLSKPIKITIVNDALDYIEEKQLPYYNLKKLPANFLDKYSNGIAGRFMGLSTNVLQANWIIKIAVKIFASLKKKAFSAMITEKIKKDLVDRKLM